MTNIDITFNTFSDTPAGKDPDSFSPTLRRYHQKLWSKPLPGGTVFELDLDTPKLLHHRSGLGEFFLSSDAIGHSYKNVKKMSPIIGQLPASEVDAFFDICSTIGGYIVFPSKRIDGKMTINGSRGVHHNIQDRFDLTLECIRRFYAKQQSPLSATFERYARFFDLFEDFPGYVEFFLLEDLVLDDFQQINFWHPFRSFEETPLPQNLPEYLAYKSKVVEFITNRNDRILRYSNETTPRS
ncbi:MAG: hypothetical protein J4F41_05370 [Alphaproteobacteria bacterium]|nr:hypothetical protein [Alphaproteobacteria bacterium]